MSKSENEKDQSNALEGQRTKILLAEDDKDDTEFFVEAINDAGIEADIKIVENGQELIDHLKDADKPNPDIVFVDINMPLKTGTEALAEIKSDSELRDIPTVMFSTSDNPNTIRQAFNAGADMYVQKPNSYRNFVGLLRKVFSFLWAGRLIRSAWKYFFISEKHLSQKNH